MDLPKITSREEGPEARKRPQEREPTRVRDELRTERQASTATYLDLIPLGRQEV